MRAVAFGAMWILLGKRVWFFPNILAEEATLKELFRFWPKKDEEEPPKWTSRLFYTVVAIVVVMLLRRHAPDEAARARYTLLCPFSSTFKYRLNRFKPKLFCCLVESYLIASSLSFRFGCSRG